MAPKPLLMIVEHNQRTQDILRTDLEPLGYKILPILTTEEAWGRLEEGTIPDVMVLGYCFPGIDGPDFFRRLKGDARFKEMLIVPLIGQSQQEPLGPGGIVTNTWQEVIDKTPPQLINSIRQALRQKTGKVKVWAWLIKRMAIFNFIR